MKTSELIDLLSAEAGPAPRAVTARRLTPVVVAGALASALLALASLGPIPDACWRLPAPWVKLVYAGSLAAGAVWLVGRLGRPSASARGPLRLLVLVAVLVVLMGGLGLLATPPDGRLDAVLGHSWSRCPLSILGLSLPAFGGALWALRGLAPTRLRAAGLAAGLLAGALGALGYALACTELSVTFVAIWYSLGIAMPGLLGLLIGPRLLRW